MRVPQPAEAVVDVPGRAFLDYRDEPPQMPSGAVGKNALLRLGFERRGPRTILVDLETRVPYLAQRVLHCDEALSDMAWLFLITTTGCVLQGDRSTLEISLGPNARAHVTTQSATKIHAMDANYALQTQHIRLADGAYLELLPEALLPHRNSRYACHTRIDIAPSASLLYAEIVQPGRKHHHPHECFGMTVLSLATSVFRPDGRALVVEKLLIEPGRYPLRQTGVMDGFDVFGNVILCTPPEVAARVIDAAGADVDLDAGIAYGAGRLPNDAGAIFKVLGRDTAAVKASVREFWRIARKEIVGADIPAPFFWR
jgi:urease accessory protein